MTLTVHDTTMIRAALQWWFDGSTSTDPDSSLVIYRDHAGTLQSCDYPNEWFNLLPPDPKIEAAEYIFPGGDYDVSGEYAAIQRKDNLTDQETVEVLLDGVDGLIERSEEYRISRSET